MSYLYRIYLKYKKSLNARITCCTKHLQKSFIQFFTKEYLLYIMKALKHEIHHNIINNHDNRANDVIENESNEPWYKENYEYLIQESSSKF